MLALTYQFETPRNRCTIPRRRCPYMIFLLMNNERNQLERWYPSKKTNDADPVAPISHNNPPNDSLATDLRGYPFGGRFPCVGFIELERQTKSRDVKEEELNHYLSLGEVETVFRPPNEC